MTEGSSWDEARERLRQILHRPFDSGGPLWQHCDRVALFIVADEVLAVLYSIRDELRKRSR